GVVAPTGIGTQQHWETTLRGELRVSPIEEFDAGRYGTTLAGRVPDFAAADHVEDRLAVQTDRWTHLALAAARFALADAGYATARRAGSAPAARPRCWPAAARRRCRRTGWPARPPAAGCPPGPTPGRRTSRSTCRRAATCPARVARCCWWRTWTGPGRAARPR